MLKNYSLVVVEAKKYKPEELGLQSKRAKLQKLPSAKKQCSNVVKRLININHVFINKQFSVESLW